MYYRKCNRFVTISKPVLVTKQEICNILSKIALFHTNCYFIGKVSPMYGFLAGFSSPESIFAGKILISCSFCHQNRKYVIS